MGLPLSIVVFLFVGMSCVAEPAKSTAHQPITVEFAVSESANVMDLAGPWEVFQDAHDWKGFRLVIVSDKKGPVHMTGGMTLEAQYSYDDAPPADIISVGAQNGSLALRRWLTERYASGTEIMSVCTGAFQFAAAGLLTGKQATTHHDFYDELRAKFPSIKVVPGDRYVQSGPKLYTAGGLTSGIDLALHVVAVYCGEKDAAQTADRLEYTGTRWRSPKGTSPVSD